MASKSTFVIPTINEVAQMMKNKCPKWPEKFILYYSERFHSHYESNGWKVGGRGAMKNFTAAFTSQWKRLRFKEDMDMLDSLTPKPKPVDKDTLDYVNEILTEYRKDADAVEEIRTASCYEWCKEQGFFLRLTQDQRNECIDISKQDLTKARSVMVRYLFDYMVSNLLTFNYFFNEVSK